MCPYYKNTVLKKQINFPFNDFKIRFAANAGVHFITPGNL